MIKGLTVTLLATTFALGGISDASAKASRRLQGVQTTMAEGAYVLPPVSFTKFCIDYPDECAGGSARVHMDHAHMQALQEVNRDVNGSIAPVRNTTRLHFWKLNVAEGDCNNYAVQKRHELIQRGWPAGALSLSVVKTSWGEGHLVVSVRTDAGDYVLDNLRNEVVEWRSAGYHWIMRQSLQNPQYWVALNGGTAARPAPAEDMVATARPDDGRAAVEAPAPSIAQPIGGGLPRGGRGMILGLADLPALPAALAPTRLTLGEGLGAVALYALPAEPYAAPAAAGAFFSADWALDGLLVAGPHT